MTTFVGREHELERLLAGLEDALAGRGRLFLVSGEPGIGKSRLADELTRAAQERGAVILVGRCWEAGGAPAFWPWVQAIRTRVRERDLEALRTELGAGAPYLVQIMPELRELLPGLPEPPALETEGARFQLFDAVGSFFRRSAQAQPLVLVLDDLHAADEPSLLLLRFLARGLSESRLLLVAAYRDVDPTLADPLAATLAELIREPSTESLELSGLAESELTRFIEVTTGLTPAPSLAAAVHSETEGNPLFAGEIVRLLAAEGALEQAGDRLALPQSVKEVIGRRLHHLSDECQRVLTLASVLGREFDFDAVAFVSGLEPDVVLGLLDEAMSARVVSELPGAVGRLRFAHQLIRDTLYESMPTSRRLQLHREVGEALEALYGHDLDPHLAELALHFFEAAPVGGRERAIDYARRAGDRAVRLLAYEEAVRLYELALKLVEGEVRRCELLLSIGDAQARAGDPPAFMATYRQAAELAERLGLPEQLAQAALGYGGRLSWEVSRDADYLESLLERALAALSEDDSVLRVRVLARLAGGPLRDASFPLERRRALSQEALDMARRIGDPATLAWALVGYISSHHSPDFTPEQVELAAELVPAAMEAGDLERAIEGHEDRLLGLVELADMPRARAELAAMAKLADELRQPSQRWIVAVYEALLALLEGRLDEAEDMLLVARDTGEHVHSWNAVVTYRLQLYVLRWEQGRLAELEEVVRASVHEYPTYPIWRCVLAHLAAELGRKDEARQLLEIDLPFDEEWLVGMGFLSEATAMLGDKERAETLYELLLPYADRVAVSYPEIALGSVSRYLGILASTMGRWDDAERHFQDALAVHERIGAQTWLTRTQENYAAMLCARDGHEPVEDVETLAAYRIEGEIARGGMGVVYRARDERLGRPVALKVIAPELAEDPGFRERFLAESRLAASLDHPNVVPIYEAGEEDGQLFIAMRYVDGSDLKSLLAAERRLPAEQTLAVCGQVAAALDAAHAKGLVHRDVKPANVLLDEREHAYLADFGLTKQAGGSTDTGRLLGTLDYLAPEQIRGEDLDGRTDEYALACVLCECVSGMPPFRRSTEAETLWAHMHEKPPGLLQRPELDPVVARALAKEKDGRYPTCGEFVDAAREALGLETPRLRRRRRLIRRSRALLVAGALVLAGAITALVVELTGGGTTALASIAPNSVGVIDPGSNKLVAQTPVGYGPIGVAVGAGSVWIANATDQTVSRLDPKTKRVVATIGTGRTPSAIAVGDGAVWVANALGERGTVSRIEPASNQVVSTTITRPGLPDPFAPPSPSAIAVGGGIVWTNGNPRALLARFSSSAGALRRALSLGRDNSADGLAVGEGALWVSSSADDSVLRVDENSGRVTAIRVAEAGEHVAGPYGIAVGDGSIWVADSLANAVSRIDPRLRTVTATIPVGVRPTNVAVGDGAIWVLDRGDGTVSRIDPKKNAVTATVRVGDRVTGIAAGAGAVWVTVAGGPAPARAVAPRAATPLAVSSCSAPVYGGSGRGRFLVASDLPRFAVGETSATTAQMQRAIRLVLEQHHFRAGRYTVGYQACDDSTRAAHDVDPVQCGANARAYAGNSSLLALVGAYNSFCTGIELPITNASPSGPLATISPSNTYVGLTTSGPATSPLEPDQYYPTGVRSFARVVGNDQAQGAADALLAKQLGLRRIYVLDDGSGTAVADATYTERAATRLGLSIVGRVTWNPSAKRYLSLARHVAGARPDGIYFAGCACANGLQVLRDLKAALGRNVTYFAPDDVLLGDVWFGQQPTAGMYQSIAGEPLARLSPGGRRFAAAYRTRYGESIAAPDVVAAAQSAEVALDAIARSNGTRASVVRELLATRVIGRQLGTFGFDRNGDPTRSAFTIYRFRAGKPPHKPPYLSPADNGGVVDRVIVAPASLAAPLR